MTRPTTIFFGPDGGGAKHDKIYIRTLLYSSSDRGQYIQNMFIRLQRGETIQNFNLWVYDDQKLARGSGLYVDKSGIVCSHHFLLPNDDHNYVFLSGDYVLQLFVETVDKKPRKIFEQKLTVAKEQYDEMQANRWGIYFDWAPNTQSYISHIDKKPKQDFNDLLNK